MTPDGLYSRRTLIQRGGLTAAGLTSAGAILAACGGKSASSTQPSTTTTAASNHSLGTVNGLVWQGYDNPKAYANLNGLHFRAQYLTSSDNEIITKLRAGGKGQFDVVSPGSPWMAAMVAADLLEPLDETRLLNIKQLFPFLQNPSWQHFDGKNYGVPITWGPAQMTARADIGVPLPARWAELADPRYRGKLVTIDDQVNLYLLLKGILQSADFSRLTKDQLASAATLFSKIKPNLVTISPSYGDVIDVLARKDAALCIEGYAYIDLALARKGIRAHSFVPATDGSINNSDVLSIPKGAKNIDGAYAVLNEAISAHGNLYMNAFQYSIVTNPSTVPLLPKAQQTLYPYSNLGPYVAKTPFYSPPPLQASGQFVSQTDVADTWQKLKG
jgi:spermidine/putrescine transport system substrate-binding protein